MKRMRRIGPLWASDRRAAGVIARACAPPWPVAREGPAPFHLTPRPGPCRTDGGRGSRATTRPSPRGDGAGQRAPRRARVLHGADGLVRIRAARHVDGLVQRVHGEAVVVRSAGGTRRGPAHLTAAVAGLDRAVR